MKYLLGKVFFLGVFIFVRVVVVGIPVNNTLRRAKFMHFTADDMLQDVFDGVEDPLPVPGKLSQNERSSKINGTGTVANANPIVFKSVKTSNNERIKMRTNSFAMAIGARNHTLDSDESDEKFEIFTTTPDYFFYPMKSIKPVTEKTIVVYEGSEYVPQHPTNIESNFANDTEQIKVLWNSVGDAVEKIPFLPVQLNIPDMIAAMANFLVTYVPFMNRITNPNRPRVPYKTNNKTGVPYINYYETMDFSPLDSVSRREYRVREDGVVSKKRRKNKRKADRKRNAQKKNASKGIFNVTPFSKTTASPVEDTKLWNALGSDQKETFKLKNMPITRKRIRVADREIFNFKNSDISNSPIMILNVPQRPITHYKIIHQELADSDQGNREKREPLDRSTEQIMEKSAKAATKKKRKIKSEGKVKKSQKRTVRSQNMQPNNMVTVP